jgi:hypothetical protein
VCWLSPAPTSVSPKDDGGNLDCASRGGVMKITAYTVAIIAKIEHRHVGGYATLFFALFFAR